MATQPSQTEGTSTPAPAPAPAPVASEVPTATTTAEAPQPDAVPEISVPPTPTAVPTPASAPEKVQEEPEPHNSITEKFSNQEWISLKEFRAILPDLLADAFPDDPKAKETPFTMWGVNIDPSNPRNAKVSVILMKFLRARHLNVNEAKDMLRTTLRWRKSFDIDSALNEEFPNGRFDNMGQIAGHDKEGRPVMYNLYGGNKDLRAVFSDVQLFLRWRVALQERLMQQLDFETVDQTIQVHDYTGVGLTSRDANSKNAASEATNIFTSHYPEILHRKFFIGVPTLLNWIFWAMKPLIPAVTLAKMSVVGTSRHEIHKALSPYIDDTQIPKRYGGQGDGF